MRKRACALCKRCVDSFHVAEWATDVLDEVRKDCWRAAL
ncbi:transposase [Atopobium sp. oral taxon 416]|nr:transposase [Atopobium sp. oral taxon 416]